MSTCLDVGGGEGREYLAVVELGQLLGRHEDEGAALLGHDLAVGDLQAEAEVCDLYLLQVAVVLDEYVL